MPYVMQARSSTTGQMVTWNTEAADWAAAEFPGPGTASHVAGTRVGNSESGSTGSTTNGTVTQSAAEVATTNATPTQIGSTFAIAEDAITTVDEEIRCVEEGAAKAKLWSVRRHYLNTGGTITETTQEDLAGPDEVGGATAASVSLTRTGATARTEVTGVAATSLRWSMQRQVVSLAAPAVAPLPLSVDSVAPSSGLIAGGTAVTITGTGFDTGADVEFDGVTATSIVVVNSTSITCVTPAGSAGTADVTVTNPDTETDTLVGGYTYSAAFDPASMSLDGWFRASFTGAPLVGTASAGASGGRTYIDNGVHATPAVGATVNGHDAVLFTAATPTALDTALTADNYASDTAYSGWLLCRVATVATDSVNAYENATGLGSTPGGYFGVAFRSSGAVQVYHFDGGFDPAEAAFTVGAAWQLVQWNFNGAALKVRVNNGSWVSIAKTTMTYPFSAEYLRLGLDASGTYGSNVEVLDHGLRAASTPDATFDDVRTYCNTRYGLSL